MKDADFPVRKLFFCQKCNFSRIPRKIPQVPWFPFPWDSHFEWISTVRGARSPRRRPTSWAPPAGPGDANGSDASADPRSQEGGHPPGLIHGKPKPMWFL